MDSCPECLSLKQQLESSRLQLQQLELETSHVRENGQRLYEAYESKVALTNHLTEQLEQAQSYIDDITAQSEAIQQDYDRLVVDLKQQTTAYNILVDDYETLSESVFSLQCELEGSFMQQEDLRSVFKGSFNQSVPMSIVNSLSKFGQRINSLSEIVDQSVDNVEQYHSAIAKVKTENTNLLSELNQIQSSNQSKLNDLEIKHQTQMVLESCLSSVQSAVEMGYYSKLDTYRTKLEREKGKRESLKQMIFKLNQKLILEGRRIDFLTSRIKKMQEIAEFDKEEDWLRQGDQRTIMEKEMNRMKEMMLMAENEAISARMT
ncbi:hypothetical protein P9112_009045 [Eukaryota sp. TZLM1-RC]